MAQAQRLGLHLEQRRHRGNLLLPGKIRRWPALPAPLQQPYTARGLEPLPWAGRTAPAPSTPRTASRRRPATPPSTSSRGRSPSRTSRCQGRRRRWSARRRCGPCSSSSTAPCSASRGLQRGRCQAQGSPKWLQGGPRAEVPGPRTWGPQGLRGPRDIVSSQDPICPGFCMVICDCSRWD